MDEKRAGLITKEEYFEWKLNWPDTCDACGSTRLKNSGEKRKKYFIKQYGVRVRWFSR